MQGVLQQAHAIVVAVVALHAELVPDFDVLAVAHGGELVHAGGVGDADIGLVEVAHVGGVEGQPLLGGHKRLLATLYVASGKEGLDDR